MIISLHKSKTSHQSDPPNQSDPSNQEDPPNQSDPPNQENPSDKEDLLGHKLSTCPINLTSGFKCRTSESFEICNVFYSSDTDPLISRTSNYLICFSSLSCKPR